LFNSSRLILYATATAEKLVTFAARFYILRIESAPKAKNSVKKCPEMMSNVCVIFAFFQRKRLRNF